MGRAASVRLVFLQRFQRKFPMKLWLFLSFLVAFSPCMAADKPVPPNGQQILQIFLQNINKPLKDEPWCQMRRWGVTKEGDDENDPKFLFKTMAEFVAAVMGEDSNFVDDENFLGPTIDTFCDPELKDLIVPDYPQGWVCGVNIGTGTKEEPRFTVTSIEIIIKSDLSGIVPGTIKCW